MSETTDVSDERSDDDLTTLLAKREHARPNRLTWVLLVLLVIAGGFAAGVFVDKRFGQPATTTPFAARFAGGGLPTGSGFGAFGGRGATFPGAGQAATTGGQATPGTGLTAGTVKLVDGTNLYITDATGNTVKVKVPASASVTSQKKSALADLAPGATVVIRGEEQDDGTLTASSVSETAAQPAATSKGDTP